MPDTTTEIPPASLTTKAIMARVRHLYSVPEPEPKCSCGAGLTDNGDCRGCNKAPADCDCNWALWRTDVY
jgi:hypothetical protein